MVFIMTKNQINKEISCSNCIVRKQAVQIYRWMRLSCKMIPEYRQTTSHHNPSPFSSESNSLENVKTHSKNRMGKTEAPDCHSRASCRSWRHFHPQVQISETAFLRKKAPQVRNSLDSSTCLKMDLHPRHWYHSPPYNFRNFLAKRSLWIRCDIISIYF